MLKKDILMASTIQEGIKEEEINEDDSFEGAEPGARWECHIYFNLYLGPIMCWERAGTLSLKTFKTFLGN